MRINAVGAATFSQTEDQASQPTVASAEATTTASRALVVVEPVAAAQDRPMAYRDAPFLAHLIATNAQMPQTRSRRRAEPQEALMAYRNTAKVVA